MRVSVVFPLLVLYARRFGWIGITAALIAASVCTYERGEAIATAIYVASNPIEAIVLTGCYASLFLLGIIAAVRLDGAKTLLRRVPITLHAVIFVGAAVIWVVLGYLKADTYGHADVFYGLLAMYVILLCVAFPELARKLAGRALRWLGEISYSLYLIHLPVLIALLYIASGHLSSEEMMSLAFPVMMLSGYVMHRLVERPSMEIGRKLARRLEK
jgi:peptidoglycan/LPS O-acetylase OafA/YrhL